MCFFYLLTNWTKYEKYKNPKGKRKLTIKYTIRVDLTVENLLHIKKFSLNFWKVLYYQNILSQYKLKEPGRLLQAKQA